MKMIQKIEPSKPKIQKRLKVAVYCRVSVEKGRTMHSLSAQVSYYNTLIQKNPDWEFAGVYSDSGISGGSAQSRLSFQQMMQDAEIGKIDVILTKSISRFARNTVDLLETVRHLKSLGADVRFEKENIHSLDGDGELMISILASFAQEEIQSMSKNIKWAIQKRYKQGLPNSKQNLYGYRWKGDELVVVPEEAEIVGEISANFYKKIPAEKTAKLLTARGVKSFTGGVFKGESVRSILLNNTYTGDLQLQKEYVIDPLSMKSRRNKGKLPTYIVEDHHEAIISKELWQETVDELARRLAEGSAANWSLNTSCFTSKIQCGCCKANYTRKRRKLVDGSYYYWNCHTLCNKGRAYCDSHTTKDWQVREISAEVKGLTEFDEEIFTEQIERIIINDYELIFLFKDGKQEKITLFLEALNKVDVIDQFDESLFRSLVEQMTVNIDGTVVVQFKNDSEIGIEL